jgi:hypothetical protein
MTASGAPISTFCGKAKKNIGISLDKKKWKKKFKKKKPALRALHQGSWIFHTRKSLPHK